MRFAIDPRDAGRIRRAPSPPRASGVSPSASPAEPAAAAPSVAAPAVAAPAVSRPARATAAPPATPAPATSPAAAAVALPPPVAKAVAFARARPKVVAIAVAILLLSGFGTVAAMYAMDAGPFAYPEQYLLRGDEMPRGLHTPPPDADAREEIGMMQNPGELDWSRLRGQIGGPEPDAVWGQFLAEVGDPDPVIGLVALKYASTKDADAAANGRIQLACAGGMVTVMKDGDVVLVIVHEDEDGQSWRPAVMSALVAQNDDLVRVCGGR